MFTSAADELFCLLWRPDGRNQYRTSHGDGFLYSSLQLHFLEENPLIGTSSLRKIVPIVSMNPSSVHVGIADIFVSEK